MRRINPLLPDSTIHMALGSASIWSRIFGKDIECARTGGNKPLLHVENSARPVAAGEVHLNRGSFRFAFIRMP